MAGRGDEARLRADLPGIHVLHHMTMAGSYVYILASFSGTVYVGLTDDLWKRVYEHKAGLVDGFTKKYQVNRLMYFETLRDQKSFSGEIGRILSHYGEYRRQYLGIDH